VTQDVDVLTQAIPLSLYIHLPWCVKKCPYCDFNSHEFNSAELAEKPYVDALIRDLQFDLAKISKREVSSIFIGGGTPSLFSVDAIRKVLTTIRTELDLKPGLEITLEANPGTAEAERFEGYREVGVNRLSIGIQSFDDQKLKSLGRIHNGEESLQAIELAKQSGFDNFNLDLMYGLPEQSIDEALLDLEIACSQSATHISWYQLTIEPNTVFYKQTPVLPAHEESWEMQRQGQKFLADNHYRQYEISAYARKDKQCLHNMNYWQFGDYLGIGAGAHGKLSNIENNEITRFARHRIPAAYMQKAGSAKVVVDEKLLKKEDIVLEFMMNIFRLESGFSSTLFSERSGISYAEIQPLLDKAVARDFIILDQHGVKPTDLGKNYLNDLLEIFMSDAD
jgi:putative oxygen-independent coproporphyrinogen III oxidase